MTVKFTTWWCLDVDFTLADCKNWSMITHHIYSCFTQSYCFREIAITLALPFNHTFLWFSITGFWQKNIQHTLLSFSYIQIAAALWFFACLCESHLFSSGQPQVMLGRLKLPWNLYFSEQLVVCYLRHLKWNPQTPLFFLGNFLLLQLFSFACSVCFSLECFSLCSSISSAFSFSFAFWFHNTSLSLRSSSNRIT